MRKYENPEVEVMDVTVMDVVTVSGEPELGENETEKG